MPTPEEILFGLGTIANDWQLLALLWHGYFGVLIVGLLFGVRPSVRVAGILLALPFLSVSALAWVSGNPFNGLFFVVAGIALLFISARLPLRVVRIAPIWLLVLGALIVGFGWVYPHFLEDTAPVVYLYAAPTGLIPCPTVSIVIGFTLVLDGLESRAWCLTLAVVGLFYGAFGAARLGVTIDWVLFASALLTGYLGLSRHQGQKTGDFVTATE